MSEATMSLSSGTGGATVTKASPALQCARSTALDAERHRAQTTRTRHPWSSRRAGAEASPTPRPPALRRAMKPGIQGVLTPWNPPFIAFLSRDHGPPRAPQNPNPADPRSRGLLRRPLTPMRLPYGQVDEAAQAGGQAVDRERRQRA